MRGEDPKLGYLLCQLEWLWFSRECLPLEKRGGRLQWVIYRLQSYKSGIGLGGTEEPLKICR